MKFVKNNIFNILILVSISTSQYAHSKFSSSRLYNSSKLHNLLITSNDTLFDEDKLCNGNKSFAHMRCHNLLNNIDNITTFSINKYNIKKMLSYNSNEQVFANNTPFKSLLLKESDNNKLHKYLNNIEILKSKHEISYNKNLLLANKLYNNGIKYIKLSQDKEIIKNKNPINIRFFKLSFTNNNKLLHNAKLLKNKKLIDNKQLLNNKKKINTNNLSIHSIIQQAESKKNIPSGLLKAIGLVESRLQPYAINYNGRGYFFNNKKSALQFANNLLRKGETNFGVGCFQLHYKSHARKFPSVSVMLDPQKNIEYAAKLLNNLYKEHGYRWSNAVKRYHSSRSDLNSAYYYKVIRKFGRSIV